MDDYGKIEKAKSLVPFEEQDKEFLTTFFVTLRLVGCELKDRVKLIGRKSRDSRNFDVDFKYLLNLPQTEGEEEPEINILYKKADELSSYLAKESQMFAKDAPTANGLIGKLILLEAVTNNDIKGGTLYERIINVRRSLINTHKDW